MRPNRRFEWNEGPDDELRALLREWKAPEPPRQVERALVWSLRRRMAWKRRAPWLAAAACLALVLLGRLTSTPTAPSAGTLAPDAAREAGAPGLASPSDEASARPPVRATNEPTASPEPPRIPRPAEPTAHRATAAASPVKDPVLVEPGQAALLAELARDLRGARQSPPGAPLPAIEVIPAHSTPPIDAPADVELQPYQMRWESVGSEWPSMRRAL